MKFATALILLFYVSCAYAQQAIEWDKLYRQTLYLYQKGVLQEALTTAQKAIATASRIGKSGSSVVSCRHHLPKHG